MGKVILILLLIIPSFANSQNKIENLRNNNSYIKTNINFIEDKNIIPNDSNIYKSFLTTGIGLIYLTNSNAPIRPMFSLYLYPNLYFITKYLYLGLGTDIYPEPKYASVTRVTFNVLPTLCVNLIRKKLSVYIGGGFCIYSFPLIGSLISIRTEYNINNKLSIGLEFKSPNFGNQEFRDNTLLLNHVFISLKF